MIIDFKIFEKFKIPENYFYVFALPTHSVGLQESSVAVIKIVSINRPENKIDFICYNTYKVLSGRNFFDQDIINDNTISFKQWKNNQDNILFETDNKEDAIDFFNIYMKDKTVNRENFELKRDSNKFAL